MAKLVTKWRYLKPDAARHAQAYIRYIATREGVEKYVEENGARPAVQAQRVLVEKLLRDFPDARRSFEYEDYARRPTVRNASEFITRTLEEHLELFDARSNYVSYIAQRPRVQRSGAHGLFTQEEDAPDLNAAARAVSEHDGNIWTCILSLRREDAARLSYDKADAWRALLRANAAEIAVPDQMDLRRRLQDVGERLAQSETARLDALRQRLDSLAKKRVLTDHLAYVEDRRMELLHVQQRLGDLSGAWVGRRREQFSALAAALDAMSPLKVLSRGYAIVQDKAGRLVKTYQDAAVGDQINITLGEGGFTCTVDKPWKEV